MTSYMVKSISLIVMLSLSWGASRPVKHLALTAEPGIAKPERANVAFCVPPPPSTSMSASFLAFRPLSAPPSSAANQLHPIRVWKTVAYPVFA